MLYILYIYILKYYKYVNMCVYIYYNIYHIYIYIINMSIYDIQWRISVFVGKSIGHHQGTGPSLPAAAVHRTSSVASTRSKRGHPLDSAPPRFAGPRLKGFTGAKKSTGKRQIHGFFVWNIIKICMDILDKGYMISFVTLYTGSKDWFDMVFRALLWMMFNEFKEFYLVWYGFMVL